jgi:hypothetical protein
VGLAKTAGVFCEEPTAINPELQSLVGDPDDVAIGVFSQKRTNPGSLQLPNPLSPIQGDEVFFTYLWPGAVFQSHDGQQWVIEAYDFYGQIEITNRWYPRQRAQVSLMDIRHSIDQWVEPIQQVVPPAPPGVNYDAQNVRIVE